MESDPQLSTPPYFRYAIHVLKYLPNFDQPLVGGLRRKAVSLLQLPERSRVLDVGCGIGGSFSYLRDVIGQAGEVVGVEISSEVAAVAKRRIEVNHWSNVRVVVGDARTVVLDGKFDGLLLFGAPDVYGSPEALMNLRPYLKDGASVVAFGSKLTTGRFGGGLNLLLKSLMRLSFSSTPKLTHTPWLPLTAYAPEIQVQEYTRGCFFLIWGSISPRHD